MRLFISSLFNGSYRAIFPYFSWDFCVGFFASAFLACLASSYSFMSLNLIENDWISRRRILSVNNNWNKFIEKVNEPTLWVIYILIFDLFVLKICDTIQSMLNTIRFYRFRICRYISLIKLESVAKLLYQRIYSDGGLVNCACRQKRDVMSLYFIVLLCIDTSAFFKYSFCFACHSKPA